VKFLPSFKVLLILLVVLPATAYQRTGSNGTAEAAARTLAPEEQDDSYAIYSLLLRNEAPKGVDTWARAIIGETQRGRLTMCLRPEPHQESVYLPLIKDFERKNKVPFTLQSKFDLPVFRLISRDDVPKFLKENPRSGIALEVSAVGYNEDRSRALVYVGHYCGMLCGGGTFHLLAKHGGKWQIDSDFRGAPFCAWVS
jgi:hypothetical protein